MLFEATLIGCWTNGEAAIALDQPDRLLGGTGH